MQHCKINCNLGTIFVKEEKITFYKITFVPDDLLFPVIFLHYYMDDSCPSIFEHPDNHSNVLKFLKEDALEELSQIITEALKWKEYWHEISGCCAEEYYNFYLDREIEAQTRGA